MAIRISRRKVIFRDPERHGVHGMVADTGTAGIRQRPSNGVHAQRRVGTSGCTRAAGPSTGKSGEAMTLAWRNAVDRPPAKRKRGVKP
jgi:hypothetical protein